MSMPAEHMTSQTTIAELLRGFATAPALPLSGIASDSRKVGEGFLFLAVQGLTSHGLDFLDQAIAAGACAVAWDESTGTAPVDTTVPALAVPDLAGRLGEIANRFYGRPSERLGVVGITGTNGKTTVAWMIAQAHELLGNRCGYLGTLGCGVGEVRDSGGMTTPPVIELHGYLADLENQGARFAAIEVSSHALAQQRVDGVRFDTALFTNISRDHLDYHTDMRAYFKSKARLFTDCAPEHCAVNIDSDYGMQLAASCGKDVVTVSTNFEKVANGRPYLFVRSVVANANGSDISFTSSWGDGRFELCLPGDFNVANAALVLAVLLMQGVPFEQARDVMSQLQAPPGRMQRVAAEGPAVFVDYAHTPIALEAALRALRAHCRGRLWCVFGCGGDRDRGKRPQMGKAAERQSDRCVITTDNPRSEDPDAIIQDVVAGLVHAQQVTVIEDRAAAIAWAIRSASENDVVLIAGKGHEEYQDVDGERVAFSDYGVAKQALVARGAAR